MTDAERKEFERQRLLAEQRIRNIYSIEGSRLPTPPNTPPMPPFLRPPENKNPPKPHHPPLPTEKGPDRPHAPTRPDVPDKSLSRGLDLLKIFNFKNLELDSDRVLILAMALLLSTEKMDEMLMLALLYIML